VAQTLHASANDLAPDDPARFFLNGDLDITSHSGHEATTDVCSFCWEGLPKDATECPNCGKSLEEMAVAQAERQTVDHEWVPNRLIPEKGPPTAAVRRANKKVRRESETIRRLTIWARRVARERGRSIGTVLALPALVVGAAAGGQWLAYATTPGSPLIDIPLNQADKRDGAVATIQAEAPPVEIRLELLTSKGRVIATFSSGEEKRVVKVRAGRYQLRASDLSGKWQSDFQPIRALAGKTVALEVDGEILAEYHGWVAAQAAKRGDDPGAARSWRLAVKHDPNSADAHLGLAQALAGQFRFKQARAELRRAAALAPRDPRIGSLQAAIEGEAPARK
jgi:hypothetical protein